MCAERRNCDFPVILLSVILSLPLPLSGQTRIFSLEIHGRRFFSSGQLLGVLPVKVGAVFSTEAAVNAGTALLGFYRGEGFFFARLDSLTTVYSADSSNLTLSFFLSEGERSLLAEVAIHGNTVFSDGDILGFFETSIGSPLRQSVLEGDIEALLRKYENAGFPFTRIRVDSIGLDSADRSRLFVSLKIDEGPKVFLAEVKVEGNASTASSVVVREARLGRQEVYRSDKLDRIRRRLERLQIFSSVSAPELYLTEEPRNAPSVHGGILIRVQEGNTNNFDGILGYVPSSGKEGAGYFTGNIFVGLRNLFGTARKAMARWQRETQLTQELELRYSEPWIGGYPVEGGVGLLQRKQDSSYVRTRYDLEGNFEITEEVAIGGTISRETVIPSSLLSNFAVFQSDVFSFEARIRYDTRDDLRSPSSGVFYSTGYSRGTKSITGPPQFLSLAGERSLLMERVVLDWEMYVPTFPRQTGVLTLHARKVSSKQVEQSDMYQLGGTNTVRGFRENQFYGSQIVWSNLEYRFLLSRLSSVLCFVDGGYFSRPSDSLHRIAGLEKFLYGYGIGARIESGLGIVRVSYALGEGDTFSTGKIHFGIVNEF